MPWRTDGWVNGIAHGLNPIKVRVMLEQNQFLGDDVPKRCHPCVRRRQEKHKVGWATRPNNYSLRSTPPVHSPEIRFAGLRRAALGHVFDGDPVLGVRVVDACTRDDEAAGGQGHGYGFRELPGAGVQRDPLPNSRVVILYGGEFEIV